MKKLLTAALVIAVLSCSKEKEYCYSCQYPDEPTREAGCMTQEDWNRHLQSLSPGDRLRETMYCHKK